MEGSYIKKKKKKGQKLYSGRPAIWSSHLDIEKELNVGAGLKTL